MHRRLFNITKERLMSSTKPRVSKDLTVMSREPLVAGTSMVSMEDLVTPADTFFVRNHFPIPQLGDSNWSLNVGGEVERPCSFDIDSLKQMPRKELLVLMECAGNSRASIQPPIEGLLWDNGGVSTARWAGVTLSSVLDEAGVLGGAVEVLLEGADRGNERGADGEMGYSMSLSMEKALHPDTILAYDMNGERLPQEHGYPLRAVVPGWFGMTAVKWLTGIKVLSQPFRGFHQTEYYVYVSEGQDNGSPKERVTSLQVKSFVTWPGRGQYLPVGRHEIRGTAWSGNGPVAKVEVSTDDGRTWKIASLEESESPYAWRQWTSTWDATKPGFYLVRARATDEMGNIQPVKARWNFRGFANNSIHAVPVQIRASGSNQ
jgi:DMSO/TMAO reductase YedYZ molybdopterin-dependent catalytic subunit